MNLNLNIWKRGSQRAPHKPLLLLYALGKWSTGQRAFEWLNCKKEVGVLIEQFGGSAKVEVSNAFVRLRNDLDGKLWLVEGELVLGASDNPSVRALNEINNVARFHTDFEKEFSDRKKFDALVNQLLVEHFSETQYGDILSACGLGVNNVIQSNRLKRNPGFRQSVLDAYGHRCAICEYDIQFRTKIIGLEAAHLQWHNSNGPDQVTYGLALCSIHHKLLDYGAIGFNDNLELMAAKGLNGSLEQLDHLIYRHEGRQIALPRNSTEEPSVEYVRWQRKEIFKGQ